MDAALEFPCLYLTSSKISKGYRIGHRHQSVAKFRLIAEVITGSLDESLSIVILQVLPFKQGTCMALFTKQM